MALSAWLQTISQTEKRGSPRRKLRLGLRLQGTGKQVTIHDLSSTGMLIETDGTLSLKDTIELELPEAGVARANVVWNSGLYYGCAFDAPLSQAAISAALLRSLPTPEVAGSTQEVRPQKPPPRAAYKAPLFVDAQTGSAPEEETEKAPLGVRLRVILGTAIILWALIIWAISSVIRMFKGQSS